jgi:hypothetical protein
MVGVITMIVGVLCLIYRESVNDWLTHVYGAFPIRAWRNAPFSDGFAIIWRAVLLLMGITLVAAGLAGP